MLVTYSRYNYIIAIKLNEEDKGRHCLNYIYIILFKI